MALRKRAMSKTQKVFLYGSSSLAGLLTFLVFLGANYGITIELNETEVIKCAGNLEEPCVSYFNITLDDWHLQFGKDFELYLNESQDVNLTVYKADARFRPDNPNRWKPYSFEAGKLLKNGTKHEFKVELHKPIDKTVKWGLKTGLVNDADPIFLGYSWLDFIKLKESRADLGESFAVIEVTNPTSYKIPIDNTLLSKYFNVVKGRSDIISFEITEFVPKIITENVTETKIVCITEVNENNTLERKTECSPMESSWRLQNKTIVSEEGTKASSLAPNETKKFRLKITYPIRGGDQSIYWEFSYKVSNKKFTLDPWWNSSYQYCRPFTMTWHPRINLIVDSSGWGNKPYNNSIRIVNATCNNGGTLQHTDTYNITHTSGLMSSFSVMIPNNASLNDPWSMYYDTASKEDLTYAHGLTNREDGSYRVLESSKFNFTYEVANSYSTIMNFKPFSTSTDLSKEFKDGNGMLYEIFGWMYLNTNNAPASFTWTVFENKSTFTKYGYQFNFTGASTRVRLNWTFDYLNTFIIQDIYADWRTGTEIGGDTDSFRTVQSRHDCVAETNTLNTTYPYEYIDTTNLRCVIGLISNSTPNGTTEMNSANTDLMDFHNLAGETMAGNEHRYTFVMWFDKNDGGDLPKNMTRLKLGTNPALGAEQSFTPPQWSNFVNNATATYSFPNWVQFNATWTDQGDNNAFNISLFESNASGSFVNYTAGRWSGTNISTYNITVRAGIVCNRFYANDSVDLWNKTSQTCLDTAKAASTTNMFRFLDNATANKTTGLGTVVEFRGNETNSGDTDVTYGLYRNDTQLATGSGDSTNLASLQDLGSGTYEVIYNTTGGVNYSSGEIKNLFLTVVKVPVNFTIYQDNITAERKFEYERQNINITALSNATSSFCINTTTATAKNWTDTCFTSVTRGSVIWNLLEASYRLFSDGTRSKSITSFPTNVTVNFTAYRNVTEAWLNLTGSDNPRNVTLDLDGDGVIDAIMPGILYSNNLITQNTFTTQQINNLILFTSSGTTTRYMNLSTVAVNSSNTTNSNIQNFTFLINWRQPNSNDLNFTEEFSNSDFDFINTTTSNSSGVIPRKSNCGLCWVYDDFTLGNITTRWITPIRDTVDSTVDWVFGTNVDASNRNITQIYAKTNTGFTGTCESLANKGSQIQLRTTDIQNLTDFNKILIRANITMDHSDANSGTTPCGYSRLSVGFYNPSTSTYSVLASIECTESACPGSSEGRIRIADVNFSIVKTGNSFAGIREAWNVKTSTWSNQTTNTLIDTNQTWQLAFEALSTNNDRRANPNASIKIYGIDISGARGGYNTTGLNYQNNTIIESKIVQNFTDPIQVVILNANTQNASRIQFEMSPNGGGTYESVTPGTAHVFSASGRNLTWRATIYEDGRPDNETLGIAPIIKTVTITSPKGNVSNVSVDFGGTGFNIFSMTGQLNSTNTPLRINISGTSVYSYIKDNCPNVKTCSIPVKIGTESNGTINISDINASISTTNLNILLMNRTVIDNKMWSSSVRNQMNITVNTQPTGGTVEISNFTIDIPDDHNITVLVNTTGNYTGSNSTTLIARFSQFFEKIIDPFGWGFFPDSANVTELPANEQNSTFGSFNITGNATYDDFTVFTKLKQALPACQAITFSNSSNATLGTNITTSFQPILYNITRNQGFGIWTWLYMNNCATGVTVPNITWSAVCKDCIRGTNSP